MRLLFCGLAALVLLWDVMLICTALYFHIMIEKVFNLEEIDLIYPKLRELLSRFRNPGISS